MAVDLCHRRHDCHLSQLLVGVIQAFQKIDFLHALAPTQSTEPAFVVSQVILLAIFVVLGFLALRKFHPRAA
jgi:hypothetical protein